MIPEAVLVSLVTGMFAIVGILLNRTRQHAKAVREQVENHHSTNLRDENDSRHAENTQLLHQVLITLEGQGADIRGLRRDIGRNSDGIIEHDRRIRQIDERTRPRAEVQREMEENQHGQDRG